MIWIIAIAVVAVILALSVWASGGRGASDAERSSSWARGPSDGGAGGGLGI